MTGGATVLQGHVDARELLRRPGVYTTSSDQPGYGLLLGLVAAGKAQSLGETLLADGRRAVAARVSAARANVAGAITIGAEFFATAKNDYAEWREKWFREAIQNSVDAGATYVRITVDYLNEQQHPISANSDGRRFVRVSVEDDGRGMDEDVLLNKFLVLGGTGKRAVAGGIGGFGKAKELLLLPWIGWSIETNAIRVAGHGIQYDITQLSTPRHGTLLQVLMAADDCTSAEAAEAFIRKCYLPHVKFSVNDTPIKAVLKPGELVRSLEGKADLFFEKKQRLSQAVMLVRVHGMYMHDRWISSEVRGTLIVELTGKSTELLAANRDSVRDYALRTELDKFQNEVAADVKSALKKKSNMVRERYRGTGKFKVESERGHAQAAVLDALGSLQPEQAGKGKQGLGDAEVEKVLDIILQIGGTAAESDGEGPIELRPPPDALRAILQTPMLGPKHVETLAKLCAWEPDFYLINDVENFRVPAKFRPEKMPPGLRKLARFWAELCRFVLVQLNYSGEYGVGWVFSTDTGAAYQLEEDQHWLLLNPFKEPDYLGQSGSWQKHDELYSLSEPDDVNWLYAAAVHEATHMADGIVNHNESFTSAFTRNVARTANRGKQIEAIRKSVVARGPAKAKTKEGKPVPTLAELRRIAHPGQEEKLLGQLAVAAARLNSPRFSQWHTRRFEAKDVLNHLLPLFQNRNYVVIWDGNLDWRNQYSNEPDEVLELLEPSRAVWVEADSVNDPSLLWDDETRRFQVRSEHEWRESHIDWARAEAKMRGA
jgi:histidine kinase/DNA gyrase B/HSP90-like ATPase